VSIYKNGSGKGDMESEDLLSGVDMDRGVVSTQGVERLEDKGKRMSGGEGKDACRLQVCLAPHRLSMRL